MTIFQEDGFGEEVQFLSHPDHNAARFFIRGFEKDNVYWKRVSNIDDQKARIATAIASVNADMLAASWSEIDYRLDILRAAKGETWKFIDRGHESF